ncbi:hypothetical protein T190_00580 [Sinorhizobium meliloti CCBAU 01290]|nr:hypothetical protein T190_00580 [Sinorhizobium meliloti CCBAU 01290]
MAGEDGNEVGVDIDTPERLVFYTSTLKSETGDLVDSWHAVESIVSVMPRRSRQGDVQTKE